MDYRFDCRSYDPCPLCERCRNEAAHLYFRCRNCIFSVRKCKHSAKEIALMIKRENFTLKLTPEGKEQLGELINEYKKTKKKDE
jgi:hypothetical protein